MPTYDYKCVTCGAVFEYFQSMSETPLTHCECGKNGEVNRMISPGSGIIFKGSGFYVNDYKKSTPSSDSGTSTSSTPSE
jgi:putative FmdB family regulatory protein